MEYPAEEPDSLDVDFLSYALAPDSKARDHLEKYVTMQAGRICFSEVSIVFNRFGTEDYVPESLPLPSKGCILFSGESGSASQSVCSC